MGVGAAGPGLSRLWESRSFGSLDEAEEGVRPALRLCPFTVGNTGASGVLWAPAQMGRMALRAPRQSSPQGAMKANERAMSRRVTRPTTRLQSVTGRRAR
jgi:hypothetical protein